MCQVHHEESIVDWKGARASVRQPLEIRPQPEILDPGR